MRTSASLPLQGETDNYISYTPSDASSETLGSTSVKTTPVGTTDEYVSQPPRGISIRIRENGEIKRGRRGHTKSRTGCLNCKRARIKCKENRPACDYCAHRDLRCEWPDLPVKQLHSGVVIRKPRSVTNGILSVQRNPNTPGPVFSMLDFRLFNHFLQTAYPHQPIGNDSTWTHEIPCISSQFDYLLHAMLALSASDIACNTEDKGLAVVAMTHRVKAIEAFNVAVGQGLTTYEQGNAMLATCFALLFQSTLLNDGLSEYMSFIRGCIAIGIQMATKRFKFMFVKLFGDDQLEELDPLLQNAGLIDPHVVSLACRSLEKMAPLCKTKVELSVYALLLGMARNLVTSSRDAYLELRKIYALFSFHMPYIEFREFTDPDNEVCQLLQAHFVSLQLVMTPITKSEWERRKNATANREVGKTGQWLKAIHNHIPSHMMEYYDWTLWIEKEVYEFGRISNGDCRNSMVRD